MNKRIKKVVTKLILISGIGGAITLFLYVLLTEISDISEATVIISSAFIASIISNVVVYYVYD